MSLSRLHQWPRGPVTALHEAALHGSARSMAALLSSGSTDIDQGDPRGFTPLLYAAFKGDASVTSILLNKGANVFITEDQGASALFFAVQEGHLDVMKMLVKAGSDLEVRNVVDQTSLYKAAIKGYTEVARVLIEAGASTNNRGPSGTTPLWAASLEGHKEIVAMLLGANANPLLAADEEEEVVSLPLDAAAQNGHADVVLHLIQHDGVDGCGGATKGVNALCLAARFEQTGVVAILTDAGVVDTGEALCMAAENGCEGSVDFLLQEQRRRGWAKSCRGGYVHSSGPRSSHTPLCCGIDACSPRVVRRLLDAGADVTTGVHVSHEVGATTCKQTALAYTAAFIGELTTDEKDADEERLHKLEAIRRLLLQVDAVRATSWLWLRDLSFGGACAERKRHTAMTPAADTPLGLMLPILRRRARRPGVLLAALWRYSSTSGELATEDKGKCCRQNSVGVL